MDIVTLITRAGVSSMREVPERIDTTASHVFIFRTARKVLKLYRRDSSYWNTNFGDLSGGAQRIEFIRKDFAVNAAVNPAVYTALECALIVDGTVQLSPADDESDELVIVMNLVETDESFLDTLSRGGISERECTAIGEQFAHTKKTLQSSEERPSKSWYETMAIRLHDLRLWMEHLAFPTHDVETCLQKLHMYVETHRARLSDVAQTPLVYSIDGHGENALYFDNKLQFIDILWPSTRWRWTTKEYDLLRLGTDIWALSGENNFNAFLRGVKNVYQDFDETDRDFYVLYSAALDACVLKTLLASKPQKIKQYEQYYAWFLHTLKTFDPK